MTREELHLRTPLTTVEREGMGLVGDHAQAAADNLVEAFVWSDTAEGFTFWNAVHEKLEGYACGAHVAPYAGADRDVDWKNGEDYV